MDHQEPTVKRFITYTALKIAEVDGGNILVRGIGKIDKVGCGG